MEILVSFLILGAVLFVWAQFIEPRWHKLHRLELKVQKPLKQPLSILHLSDLHFTKRSRSLERFFDKLARHEVDFVFITGDIIDHAEGIDLCVAQFKKLKARRGMFAVLGNHDYRIYPPFEPFLRVLTGKDIDSPRPEAEKLKQALIQAGISVLVNESQTLKLGPEEEMVIVGIDDPVTKRADLKKAFQEVKNDSLCLALVHSPILFPALGKRKIDVAFAGHTHGGQVRLPKVGPVLLWVRRLEPVIDSTSRYGFTGLVSRGMGAQPLANLRLGCRPEALLVKIKGSDPGV